MKPEAQRIAIAETRGYRQRPDGYWMDSTMTVGSCGIPNYLGDLNAMRDARKILTPLQKSTYARILTELTWESEQPLYCAMDATAAQQAEAFLRTIGKWESPTV